MMTHIVCFSKTKYDPTLDFLKGVLIFLVVLNHCTSSELRDYILFPIWGLPAVPLFILIQVFHAYKNGLNSVKKPKWGKLWKRILRPFIIIELIIGIITLNKMLFMSSFGGGINQEMIKQTFYDFVIEGGKGPGSYFPWIYLQIAIVLPFIANFLKKMSLKHMAIAFLLVSMAIEVVCSFIKISPSLYRILFVRYFFVFFLGYVLAKKGVELNKYTICISIISIIATLFFSYSKPMLEPFFYTSKWITCHWICYIYQMYLMMFGIVVIYRKMFQYKKLTSFICLVGRSSYEIFLFQMLYFVNAHYVMSVLKHIGNEYTVLVLYITISLSACICPVLFYKRIRESFELFKFSKE